ncbi:MAG: metalloprotease [Planctomycetota bacterium]|nr:MAG: metalloprotease [Planctomycetota bacterium]
MGARGDASVDYSFLNGLISDGGGDLFAPYALLADSNGLFRLLSTLWVILQVAIGLGFVIFIHELGHFLAAKTFGVRCDKFYVGFDVPISIGPIHLPRTLAKFQWGETEYGIGIIPLGGYVKMLGQDDDPRQAEEEAARIRLGEGEDAPLDPRSYPAKPVWQRMIIISAGVIMNLVSAVFLAAIAYAIGVPNTPAITGATFGGGPAWEAGIQVGDQIVRVGDMDHDDPYLSYNDFRTQVVMHGFRTKGQPVPMTILRGKQRLELQVRPTLDYDRRRMAYLVGLLGPLTTQLGAPVWMDGSFLASVQPDLKPGDIVVEVDGDALPVDPRFDKILGHELTSRLQAKWDQPVQVVVERRPQEASGNTAAQRITVDLPPVPVNTLGLQFAVGPIRAIQAGSRAEQAGLQVGDVIEAVNGQSVENALELPAIVGRLAGQSITFSVRRSGDRPSGNTNSDGADNQILEIPLQAPANARFDPVSSLAGRLTLGGIGVAYDVSPVITGVDDASGLSESDIRPGDQLAQIQWVLSDEEREKFAGQVADSDLEPLPIDEQFTVANLHSFLQSIPAGSTLRVNVRRSDGTVSDPVELKSFPAEGWFWHQRGIKLTELMAVRQVDGIAPAMVLGFEETKRRFNEVLSFLGLLVTGKVGIKGVGGPVGIAQVAASEASFGVTRLLLFLTLLSANLAILNFLPIPALDGGHMIFLLAEAIRGKPVDEQLQMRLTMLGVLCLLALMAVVILQDILRLVT